MTRAMRMLGYVAAASVVMGVLMNLGDIRRYIKIERM